jgi:hypothetical protein
VERLRLAVGHAIFRPARSLHPGRGGRTRLPPRGPPGGPFQAESALDMPTLVVADDPSGNVGEVAALGQG